MLRACFPDHCSVLLIGSPGIGLLEFNVSLVQSYLEKDDVVIFVAVDTSPADVLELMSAFGIPTKDVLGKKLFILDYHSSILGASEERQSTSGVKLISDLEAIMFNISSISQETKKRTRTFFYSLSTLFLYNQPNVVLKFFQISNARIRMHYGSSIVSVHEGVHEEKTVNHLMAIADGVIELRFDEELNKMLRVRNMRGYPTSSQWIPFEIKGAEQQRPANILEWV
ncbi:MAG: ATPase domain-containing protein [Methanomassiliicoccales archaeon]